MSRKQKQRSVLFIVLGMVCGLFMFAGCGNSSPDASSTAEPAGAHAKLVLDAKASVYPFLVMTNTGDMTAEDVHVLEGKTGKELTTRLIVVKGTMKSAPTQMNIRAHEAAQFQVNDKDMRDYEIRWSEAGHTFSKQLVLPDLQKIETH